MASQESGRTDHLQAAGLSAVALIGFDRQASVPQLITRHHASPIRPAFNQHCRAHRSIDETNQQYVLGDFRAVRQHPAHRQSLHVVGDHQRAFAGCVEEYAGVEISR